MSRQGREIGEPDQDDFAVKLPQGHFDKTKYIKHIEFI